VASRSNIEEIVRKAIEDRSPTEIGSVNVPTKLRPAMEDATFSQLKLAVS
jgi:hypothetical protein